MMMMIMVMIIVMMIVVMMMTTGGLVDYLLEYMVACTTKQLLLYHFECSEPHLLFLGVVHFVRVLYDHYIETASRAQKYATHAIYESPTFYYRIEVFI